MKRFTLTGWVSSDYLQAFGMRLPVILVKPDGSLCPIRMLIDTGAECSVCRIDLLDGYRSTRPLRSGVGIDGGAFEHLTFHDVPIIIESDGGERYRFPLSPSGVEIPESFDFEGILGRDFLRHWELTYHGVDGRWTVELLKDSADT